MKVIRAVPFGARIACIQFSKSRSELSRRWRCRKMAVGTTGLGWKANTRRQAIPIHPASRMPHSLFAALFCSWTMSKHLKHAISALRKAMRHQPSPNMHEYHSVQQHLRFDLSPHGPTCASREQPTVERSTRERRQDAHEPSPFVRADRTAERRGSFRV